MLLGHLCLCPVFQTKPVKATRKYRSSYSAQALLGAYESVKLKGLSVHRAAIQFSVPEQTLRDRVKGRIDHTNLKGPLTVVMGIKCIAAYNFDKK